MQAFVTLFHHDLRLLRSPRNTIKRFTEDFRMVLNCHRERKFLLDTQPHLTNWLPIAVPLTKWLIWPPPFNFWPAAVGPLGLFPAFFKFVRLSHKFTHTYLFSRFLLIEIIIFILHTCKYLFLQYTLCI